MIQTFWSKYKVIVYGTISAIITAIAPLIMATTGGHYDYKALIVMAVIAGSTFFGKEARGKNWTAAGQISAMLIVGASVAQHDFDLGRMLLAMFCSAFSVPLSPVKPAEYEHTPTIAQAKVEAEAIKIENQTGQ